jgi:hypothetical protein
MTHRLPLVLLLEPKRELPKIPTEFQEQQDQSPVFVPGYPEEMGVGFLRIHLPLQ